MPGADSAVGVQGGREPPWPLFLTPALAAVSPSMGLGVPCHPSCQGVLEEGPFRRRRKRVGVGRKMCQICPLPLSVAGVHHAQTSSESTPEQQIALLPLLVHIIMVILIFRERVSCFLIRSAPKIPTEK